MEKSYKMQQKLLLKVSNVFLPEGEIQAMCRTGYSGARTVHILTFDTLKYAVLVCGFWLAAGIFHSPLRFLLFTSHRILQRIR